VDQAASDPQVLAIKQTLYRTADEESPIIRSLIKAAETGKQVVALVELRARFDEQTNIAWARVLEEAGVHLVYGVVGLKTHAKISLVVRQEDDGIRRYAHVGTGNYNPNTAHLYEDVGIFSADPKLGGDLSDLFNYLTGYSRKQAYGRILVAPLTLRPALLDLIRAEASEPDGRIVIKVNNLVDPELIDALYEASAAGTSTSSFEASAASVPELRASPSGSGSARSWAGSWNTPGSSGSDPTRGDLVITSVRPT
jgi:polyphosphate kinase